MKFSNGPIIGAALIALLGTSAQAASIAPRAIAMETTSTREMSHIPGMTDLGRVPDAMGMHIVVSLPMRNKALVNQILSRQMTPGDSMYGHFLTPSETRALFSPSGASVNAVASYLAAQSFTNIHAAPDNQLIMADAPAATVSRTFGTEIHSMNGRYGRTYANVKPALIPTSLHGMVLAVLGLNNYSAHPHILIAPRTPARAKADRATAGAAALTPQTEITPVPCNGTGLPGTTDCIGNAYNAQQFRTAYDVAANINGGNDWGNTASGTPIAIFTEGDMTQVLVDLKLYEAANNLKAITPKIIHPGIPSPDTSGVDEFDLDTQSSTGISQVVKSLYLYDNTTLSDSDTTVGFARFQTDDLAKAGSASFGICEIFPATDGSLTTEDEIFARAAVQGQTVFNSSGDNGSGCPVAASTGAPASGPPMQSYPAASPYVVAVGGTSLIASTVPGAPPVYQIGWIGSGGGISLEDSSPFWQQGVVNPACYAPSAVPTVDTMKCVPDISMDADENVSPALIYVDGATEEVGGTSLASPLALGSWAMIETRKGNKLGFAAPLLYQMYKNNTTLNATTGMYTAPVVTPPANQLLGGLIDMTLGDNGMYAALPGYDNVTGLGSIDVQLTTKDIPNTYPHGP